ncbi:MAG: ABC transporter ATP-binding protein [Geminicoccaceae bacterium]|nr:ABC transporter ATP-binding protein [Geminicoccaceae bacterium]
MPLLEVDRLCSGYGRAQILFDVSLNVEEGRVAVLLGRNGAGKSTTIESILALVPPWSGTVTFRGRPITGLPTHEIVRLGIGFVPEDRRIFADLTVMENLEVGRRARSGTTRPWTPERLFELFPNLAEMRRRRGDEMSGGEQQMLSIARTLMGNPGLLLLDEPSEGLAPVIVQAMIRSIRRLKKDGLSILLSEQNVRFAEAVADRAFVLEQGHVRFAGSMAEVADDPALRKAHLGI